MNSAVAATVYSDAVPSVAPKPMETSLTSPAISAHTTTAPMPKKVARGVGEGIAVGLETSLSIAALSNWGRLVRCSWQDSTHFQKCNRAYHLLHPRMIAYKIPGHDLILLE